MRDSVNNEPEASHGPVDEPEVNEPQVNEVYEIGGEASRLKRQLLQHRADFDNARRQWKKEREQQRLRDRDALVRDWLEVVDSLQRALASGQGAHAGSWYEGLIAISRQAQEVLHRQGVQVIPTDGFPFDPEQHEAIARMSRDDLPHNTIVHTHRPGYVSAEGSLIRPAQVVVSARQGG